MLKFICRRYVILLHKTQYISDYRVILKKSGLFLPNICVTAASTLTMTNFFKEKSDIYNGLTIDTKNIQLSAEKFEEKLNNALVSWTESSIRGLWFKVHIGNSEFIPILVKNGFIFHHAKSSYAMLTKWLPKLEPNSLPQFPHTHIGVGGLVVNDKNQMLVIQERFQHIQNKVFWKLPGGYSTPGEDFAVTAHREVLEETGIEAEFLSIVSLRHHHTHLFDCSDIYIVCHMKPKSSVITKSIEEIASCEWMDVDVYRSHPDVTEFNKFIINSFLESQELKAAIIPSQIPHVGTKQPTAVFTVKALKETAN